MVHCVGSPLLLFLGSISTTSVVPALALVCGLIVSWNRKLKLKMKSICPLPPNAQTNEFSISVCGKGTN